jgi:hypothetical protein
MCGCAIILAICIGFIAGHVFAAPAVSIFVVVYMANMNYFIDKESQQIGVSEK